LIEVLFFSKSWHQLIVVVSHHGFDVSPRNEKSEGAGRRSELAVRRIAALKMFAGRPCMVDDWVGLM
jgi:hypothetical protein